LSSGTRNADGRRRRLDPLPDAPGAAVSPPQPGIAPLLRKLLADYAATGLPPAYLPHATDTDPDQEPTR
jgi:hypothetical protein